MKYFLAIFIRANTIAGVLSTIPNLPPCISNLIFATISNSLTIFTLRYIVENAARPDTFSSILAFQHPGSYVVCSDDGYNGRAG